MTLHKLSNQSAERIKESYKIVPIIYNLPLLLQETWFLIEKQEPDGANTIVSYFSYMQII